MCIAKLRFPRSPCPALPQGNNRVIIPRPSITPTIYFGFLCLLGKAGCGRRAGSEMNVIPPKLNTSLYLKGFSEYTEMMLQRVVKKQKMHDSSSREEELKYWLSQPPEARIEAVELLRNQWDAGSKRLQRVARVIQRPSR